MHIAGVVADAMSSCSGKLVPLRIHPRTRFELPAGQSWLLRIYVWQSFCSRFVANRALMMCIESSSDAVHASTINPRTISPDCNKALLRLGMLLVEDFPASRLTRRHSALHRMRFRASYGSRGSWFVRGNLHRSGVRQ